ncbi:unnamed protein product [Cercopithifilaria johnstoni]|uniref:Uncharacterized protein n=1 Tax=Cercopithifilaria johnstoni TaxID=2874296 RepID=A0A8J2Q8R9_9BILA|nr:unnamed protein product [Cercopithifilaria johnstoni]
MNNNVPGRGNPIRDRAGPGAAAGAATDQVKSQTTSSPLGPLSPILTLLGGNLYGTGSPYPYYPYYSGYGAYNPYVSYYYYGGYPYYYYYYYYYYG